MANVKKGLTVAIPAIVRWWKHLKPDGKRRFWKCQRKADKKMCKE